MSSESWYRLGYGDGVHDAATTKKRTKDFYAGVLLGMGVQMVLVTVCWLVGRLLP